MIKVADNYSAKVGARKATHAVVANTVVSAAPATFLITVCRYNGIDYWPESADPAATAALMALLTGLPRFIGDFLRVNYTEPRYAARQGREFDPRRETENADGG